MAGKGKSISLYLIDGELTGRIKYTTGSWIGIAYKSPRLSLEQFEGKDLTYLHQAGVYFLLGTDKRHNQTVYIGQASVRKNGKGLLGRVQEPHSSIDWTEAVMLTTKDNSFGLDDISYLENYFCNLALEAGQYHVTNGNDPNPGNISEERQNELDEYIDYMKMVMHLLGYKVFEKDNSQKQNFDDADVLLHMKYNNGKATGRRTADGFIIYRGSTVNPVFTKSCPEGVKKMREKFSDKINDSYELTSDIFMASPSAAARFIGGASLNGLTMWRDSEGRTLKEIES